MARSAVTLEILAANQSPASQDKIQPDATYLFACHLQWEKYGDLKAYEVLISALDSNDEEARAVAQTLLRRKSPRPKSCSQCAPTASFAGQER
jgi:hypothetical protein